MPATVWFGGANAVRDSVKYKYDVRGNIIEITQNGHLYARYKYDSLNRLIREDNKALDKTTVFAYDSNGNITERCEYAYTSRDGEELTELACTHYSYDYAGDRLVSYNGAAISYNTMDNPASYLGKALTWEYGKRLTKYGNTTFAYNGAGRRISKNNISYIYDSDGRLLKQSNGLEFIYDNSCVIGVKYGGNTYFYRRDAQGNIAAILDNNGNIIVQYLYDAWGNHAVVDSNGNDIESGIGILNPFRYRGYYYDTETELYYLQTRYYDPEVGRFISRDSIEYADPEAINGLNLYAYCGDNPVNYVDPTGNAKWWQWLLGIVVVALVTVATVVTAGAAAVAIGASATVVNGVMAGAAIGGAVAGGMNLVSQGINGDIDFGKLTLATVSGAAVGAVGGGVGNMVTPALGGAKLLVQKGAQVAINVIVSNTSYIITSALNNDKITFEGLLLSTVNGFTSGILFNKPIQSFIASIGGEFLAYLKSWIKYFKRVK